MGGGGHRWGPRIFILVLTYKMQPVKDVEEEWSERLQEGREDGQMNAMEEKKQGNKTGEGRGGLSEVPHPRGLRATRSEQLWMCNGGSNLTCFQASIKASLNY